VWDNKQCLPLSIGLFNLAESYPSLGTLFRNVLHVPNLTPESLQTKLRSIISDFRSQPRPTGAFPEFLARRVVSILLAINSKGFFHLSLSMQEALRTEKLWPYRSPLSLKSDLKFGSLTDDIIIPDNDEYLALFQEKVSIFYISPKAVRSMRLSFLQLGLEHKFISSRVNSTTSSDGVPLPSADLSGCIAQRADALFRYVWSTYHHANESNNT
jgi:hypothetical protein